jgi:hypothetical protein
MPLSGARHFSALHDELTRFEGKHTSMVSVSTSTSIQRTM